MKIGIKQHLASAGEVIRKHKKILLISLLMPLIVGIIIAVFSPLLEYPMKRLVERESQPSPLLQILNVSVKTYPKNESFANLPNITLVKGNETIAKLYKSSVFYLLLYIRNDGDLPAIINSISIEILSVWIPAGIISPSYNYTIILNETDILAGLNLSMWNGTLNATLNGSRYCGWGFDLQPPFVQNFSLQPSFEVLPHDIDCFGIYLYIIGENKIENEVGSIAEYMIKIALSYDGKVAMSKPFIIKKGK